MLLRFTLRAGCGVALLLAVSAMLSGAELSETLKTIKSVGPEGKGNAQAAAAWKQLAAGRASSIPTILAALDDANPLAANYLRNAIETIAQRELQQEGKLPAAELEAFLKETRHEPRARRLAFDLLARADKTAPDRLIPGMLNDSSVELRRDAVQRLIAQGDKQFAQQKPDDAKATFAAALAGARDDDQVQIIKKRLEGLGEKVDLPRHFGFLMTWQLVAPFDNTEKKGLNTVYPPEQGIDLNAEYEGKEGMKIRWSPHTTDNEYGIVDVAKALSSFKGAVSYATTEFVSDKEQPVELRLGTPNSWKVWLNGELLFSREEYHRGMSLDQYKMRGTLHPGRNVILVKVCQNEQKEEWAQRWQFQLRVCDAAGTAVLSADRAGK
jgi:hypothetical protein